mmetsp:Transcript_27259/g.86276  ORF Transcript_27259/g.86276 Transcript_27259/m.86276 type:complete len:235 (+) Transcript_27259:1219-1923(+)
MRWYQTGSSLGGTAYTFLAAWSAAMPMNTALARIMRLTKIWNGFESTMSSSLEAGSFRLKRERCLTESAPMKSGSETALLPALLFLFPAMRLLRLFLRWLFHWRFHFSSSSWRKWDWISVSCRARPCGLEAFPCWFSSLSSTSSRGRQYSASATGVGEGSLRAAEESIWVEPSEHIQADARRDPTGSCSSAARRRGVSAAAAGPGLPTGDGIVVGDIDPRLTSGPAVAPRECQV